MKFVPGGTYISIGGIYTSIRGTYTSIGRRLEWRVVFDDGCQQSNHANESVVFWRISSLDVVSVTYALGQETGQGIQVNQTALLDTVRS